MTKIIHEHYPVADLPEDLREGLPLDGFARVTLEADLRNPDGSPVRDRTIHHGRQLSEGLSAENE